MIYSYTEEIILLYSSDGRATLHEPETMKGHPTTKDTLDRWRKWFSILNATEESDALNTAVEQVEFLYELWHSGR